MRDPHEGPIGRLSWGRLENIPITRYPDIPDEGEEDDLVFIDPRNKTRRGRKPKVNWDAQPLGEMPGRELARRLGVAMSSESKARALRSIPAYKGPWPLKDKTKMAEILSRISVLPGTKVKEHA